MIRLAAAILALAACVIWSAVMSIGKVAADFVWRIGERIRNRPKAVARRAAKAKRKAERRGEPIDETAEEFNVSTDEVSMDIKAFLIQAVLATLRHAMTASPFAALVTDDWLLQTATLVAGIAGYVWSLKRKVKPAA